MAEEVAMTPVADAEPPKVNPLTGAKVPVASGAAPLKPGLKLPTQNAVRPGLKLPTQNAARPTLKLPPKPVIRKPGSTIAARPLPKPVNATLPKPVASTVAAPKPAAPVGVDMQGVGKLPTVEAKAVPRADAAPTAAPAEPLEALKAVTQKLKGITQQIPQQAVMHKTGIIAEGAVTPAQKEAAKHKTARISLSDAMGVAPVKNDGAPMKTIRIKRPTDIPGATKPLAPQAKPEAPATDAAASEGAANDSATITQRKTLKISRPTGGIVRPSGKFGIKHPTAAPAEETAAPEAVADIGEIPEMPVAAMPVAATPANDGPAWLWALSAVVQIAACIAVGALAWLLFQNTQIAYF